MRACTLRIMPGMLNREGALRTMWHGTSGSANSSGQLVYQAMVGKYQLPTLFGKWRRNRRRIVNVDLAVNCGYETVPSFWRDCR